jgi:cystathionine beta-lyase
MNWRTTLIHSKVKVPEGFRSLVTPVFRGSTTLFPQAARGVLDTWNHDEVPYSYGSHGTPTTLELAARIAEVEQGYRCFLTPSGLSALVLVYLAYLASGDHVLVPDSVYGPSRAFADNVLRRYGVEVEYYPALAGADIASRIQSNTRLIWCESPGSNTMEIQDVPAIVEVARERDVPVAMDNTWAAGIFFDAFAHGVSISVQALTKYIGGHSDLLLGSVTVRDEMLYERIGNTLQDLGMAVSPDECSLALRGLQTFYVRLKAIEESALRVASWLADRPKVEAVLHPALPSCPGHPIWKRDFTGSSGLFSVVFRAPLSPDDLYAGIDRLKLIQIGYIWVGRWKEVVETKETPYGHAHSTPSHVTCDWSAELGT